MTSVGRKQETLTPAQEKRLLAAAESIDQAEERWARLVRKFGYAATARSMGLTPEAVRKRVLKILGPAK